MRSWIARRWPWLVAALVGVGGAGAWWLVGRAGDRDARAPARSTDAGPPAATPTPALTPPVVAIAPVEIPAQAFERELRGRVVEVGIDHVDFDLQDEVDAGVEMRAGVPDLQVVFRRGAQQRTVRTGADGAFAIRVPPGLYRVRAEGPGFAAVCADCGLPADLTIEGGKALAVAGAIEVEVLPKSEGAAANGEQARVGDLELRVTRAGTVAGKVSEPDGRPIAGAAVETVDGRAFLTRADGTFAFEHVPGDFDIDGRHDAFAVHDSAHVTVSAGGVATATIVLRRGCFVRGRVVDPSGTPVPGAVIEETATYTKPPPRPRTSTAGDDGRFRVRSAKTYQLVLRATLGARTPSPTAAFHCADGVVIDDVALVVGDAPVLASGTLRASDGEHAAGAMIAAAQAGIEPAVVGADGSWTLHGKASGTIVIEASDESRRVVQARVALPARDVALVLPDTGTLTGRIANLRAAADQDVLYARIDARDPACGVPGRLLASRSGRVRNGRYRIDDVPACEVSVRFYAASGRAVQTVRATPGYATTLDLTLIDYRPGEEPGPPDSEE